MSKTSLPHVLKTYQYDSAEGFANSDEESRVLVWDTGLGKTRTAIASAVFYVERLKNEETRKIAIFIPGILIDHYIRELQIVLGNSYVISAPKRDKYSAVVEVQNVTFRRVLFEIHVFNNLVVNSLHDLNVIFEKKWDFAIFDEFQLFCRKKIKSNSSTRGVGSQSIPRYLNADKFLFLTATPFTNTSVDIIDTLEVYCRSALKPPMRAYLIRLINNINNITGNEADDTKASLLFSTIVSKFSKIFDFKRRDDVTGTILNSEDGTIDPTPNIDLYSYMVIEDNTTPRRQSKLLSYVKFVSDEENFLNESEDEVCNYKLLSPDTDTSFIDTYSGLKYVGVLCKNTDKISADLGSIFISLPNNSNCLDNLNSKNTIFELINFKGGLESDKRMRFSVNFKLILLSWYSCIMGGDFNPDGLMSFIKRIKIKKENVMRVNAASDIVNLLSFIPLIREPINALVEYCYKNPVIVSSFLCAYIFVAKCATSEYNITAEKLLRSMYENGYINNSMFKSLIEKGYTFDKVSINPRALQYREIFESNFNDIDCFDKLTLMVYTLMSEKGLETDFSLYTFYIEFVRKYIPEPRRTNIVNEFLRDLLGGCDINHVPQLEKSKLPNFKGILIFNHNITDSEGRLPADVDGVLNYFQFKKSVDDIEELRKKMETYYKEYFTSIAQGLPVKTYAINTLYTSLGVGVNLHNWRFTFINSAPDLASYMIQAMGRSYRYDSILNSYCFVATDLISHDYMKHLRAIQLYRTSLSIYAPDDCNVSNLGLHSTIPRNPPNVNIYTKIISDWNESVKSDSNGINKEPFHYTLTISDYYRSHVSSFDDVCLIKKKKKKNDEEFADYYDDAETNDSDYTLVKCSDIIAPSMYDGNLFKHKTAEQLSYHTNSILKYKVIRAFSENMNHATIPYFELIHSSPKYISACELASLDLTQGDKNTEELINCYFTKYVTTTTDPGSTYEFFLHKNIPYIDSNDIRFTAENPDIIDQKLKKRLDITNRRC